jgi:Kdo2-lipid IVA lauroyltransferase/acyltransferase
MSTPVSPQTELDNEDTVHDLNHPRLTNLLSEPVPPNIELPGFWSPIPKLSHRSTFRQLHRELTFRGILLLAKLVLSMGVERSAKVAASLGRLGFYVQPEQKRVALENLRTCLGDCTTEEERREIAKKVFSNFAVSALEVAWLSRWGDLFSWLKIEVEGMDKLDAALATGRGVIAHNAHFGNWEVMSAAIAKMGYPGYVVARRQKDPRLDAWIGEIREHSGLKVAIRGENPGRIVRCLKGGGLLGLMIDIDTRSNEGVFVDFFGRPTYTQVGPFALARITGALMIPALCYRDGLNCLRFYFGDPWEVARTNDPDADVLQAAQKANSILEQKIRERPEQWAWFHKRWKTTPGKIEQSRRDNGLAVEESPD